MRRLIRQPIFWLLVVLPITTAAALMALGFKQRAENNRTLQSIARATHQLESAWFSRPSPAPASVRALEAEHARLLARRGELRRALASSRDLEPVPEYRGPEELFFEIVDFTERVAAGAAAAGIRVPAEARFGFRDIVERGRIVFDGTGEASGREAMAALNRQRQILDHAINLLIAAEPIALPLVRRESVETTPTTQRLREPELFRVDPLASVREPNTLRTLAFEITFEGHTESLRVFLAGLASFDLPLVTRGVSVQPVAPPPHAPQQPAGDAGGTPARAPTPFEIFGTTIPMENEREQDPVAVPLVRGNVSRFVVTFEYVDFPSGRSGSTARVDTSGGDHP